MKKIILIFLLLIFISIPVNAKVVFMGDEMREFWKEDMVSAIAYTVSAMGCIYGGYTILAHAQQNKGVLDYTVGTVMLLSGTCGLSISFGFDIYKEKK